MLVQSRTFKINTDMNMYCTVYTVHFTTPHITSAGIFYYKMYKTTFFIINCIVMSRE